LAWWPPIRAAITSSRTLSTPKSRLLECSGCGAVRTAGELCPECGFLPKRRGEGIVFHDEDLQEVGGKLIQISLEEKQRWYRELMALREQRNEWRASAGKEPLKPAWAAAKYKDKIRRMAAIRLEQHGACNQRKSGSFILGALT
jgi:ribosomal protein L32